MTSIFNYLPRESPVHRLTGAAKLVCMLLWTAAAMNTYDTRLLAVLPVAAVLLFAVSRIRVRDVKFMLGFTFVFMLLNNALVYAFSPRHGVELYGACHPLWAGSSPYIPTQEQLFYHLNLVLKYLATIPIVLLFVCTTEPSEFAASLNRLGVSYRISYSVSLALRYIPDIQREYHDIAQAQQARGVEMSKKQSLVKRLRAASSVLIPLILSSFNRIDTVSNAMELRGFGKRKGRTWYAARPFARADYLSMGFCLLLLVVSLALRAVNGGRFYNPFA